MIGFALFSFGALLFLWISFGGPVPLSPKGYRFQVAFPEAAQLAQQADVRISGVTVGKVVALETVPGNQTRATIQLDDTQAGRAWRLAGHASSTASQRSIRNRIRSR